mmetsp:Transcript_15675/g.34262  ORF Transcript_15675/g.34262 Transcript_15675/m.34262 type:complete len:597 (+) Transcript_15675:127-1917(+)
MALHFRVRALQFRVFESLRKWLEAPDEFDPREEKKVNATRAWRLKKSRNLEMQRGLRGTSMAEVIRKSWHRWRFVVSTGQWVVPPEERRPPNELETYARVAEQIAEQLYRKEERRGAGDTEDGEDDGEGDEDGYAEGGVGGGQLVEGDEREEEEDEEEYYSEIGRGDVDCPRGGTRGVGRRSPQGVMGRDRRGDRFRAPPARFHRVGDEDQDDLGIWQAGQSPTARFGGHSPASPLSQHPATPWEVEATTTAQQTTNNNSISSSNSKRTSPPQAFAPAPIPFTARRASSPPAMGAGWTAGQEEAPYLRFVERTLHSAGTAVHRPPYQTPSWPDHGADLATEDMLDQHHQHHSQPSQPQSAHRLSGPPQLPLPESSRSSNNNNKYSWRETQNSLEFRNAVPPAWSPPSPHLGLSLTPGEGSKAKTRLPTQLLGNRQDRQANSKTDEVWENPARGGDEAPIDLPENGTLTLSTPKQSGPDDYSTLRRRLQSPSRSPVRGANHSDSDPTGASLGFGSLAAALRSLSTIPNAPAASRTQNANVAAPRTDSGAVPRTAPAARAGTWSKRALSSTSALTSASATERQRKDADGSDSELYISD